MAANMMMNEASYPSSDEEPARLNSGSSNTIPIQDARLRKVLYLIEADPLGSSQDWALQLNLSNSHLHRLFKEATGIALGQARTEKRLQKAATLLSTTNLSIKEIAYAVGYEHSSSFTRAFERRFAQPPRYFRIHNAA